MQSLCLSQEQSSEDILDNEFVTKQRVVLSRTGGKLERLSRTLICFDEARDNVQTFEP